MRLLVLGTFDLLHVGHVRLLHRASRYGHELWVGVNSDAFVVRYKRTRPVVGEQQRMEMIRALRHVDRVLLNDGPGRDLIEQTKPDALVVGSDWHEKAYLAQLGVDQEWLDSRGCGVLYLPRTEGVSTTDLRKRIAA